MNNPIQSYLYQLEKQLRVKGVFDADTLAEIEGHLLDAVVANVSRGLSQAEAEREALSRFGSVAVVSSTFEKERISSMQKILIAIAVLAGLFSLYLDTRPSVDDLGGLALLILLACGLLALIGYQRPWLLALAVGAWIPLYGVFFSQEYASVLALIVAFVGAYAGWAFRAGINRLRRPL